VMGSCAMAMRKALIAAVYLEPIFLEFTFSG
jgi:hypothetical protein